MPGMRTTPVSLAVVHSRSMVRCATRPGRASRDGVTVGGPAALEAARSALAASASVITRGRVIG